MPRPDAARTARRCAGHARAALLAAALPIVAAWAQGAGSAPPAPVAAPATVVGWPDGVVPRAPQNFRVTVYARGLAAPSALLVLPNGDVLVTEARPPTERVTLLRDGRGGGVADQQFVLLADLGQPRGLALRRDRLYVATGEAVLSCPYLVGQTRMHGACRSLLELATDGGGGRAAGPIAFNPDEAYLYVGVGGGAAQARRAEPTAGHAILVARPDGREQRVYARVLTTAAGLAFEPRSGVLWATLSAGDPTGAGDTVGAGGAPDRLTSVRVGSSHGRLPGAADVGFAASAPLGLAFYERTHFPKQFRGGAFVALHGARHGAELAGYRVVFVPFAAGKPAGAAQDFLTGFVRDAAQGEVYGRPAAVAVATDGTLLVADDAGGTIWRVRFKCAACTPDPVPPPHARRRSG